MILKPPFRFAPNPHFSNTYRYNNYKTYHHNNFPAKIKRPSNKVSSNNSIDLLGIKLDFDDFLILGLLFFLYSQNVKDDMLYVILFLLLLS